jgi:hypothetical protein
MGFLRRLLGPEPAAPTDPVSADGAPAATHAPTSAEDDERARELELLREDQDRQDDLTRRQQRYAEYAWEPPAQGGERRADDADRGGES